MRHFLIEAGILIAIVTVGAGLVALGVIYNPFKESLPNAQMTELKAEPKSGLRQICVPSPMDHNTEICGPVEVVHLKERFAYSFTDKATIECAKGMQCTAIVGVMLPTLPAK